ncbi:DUF2157 domain-containing protein [Dyella sp. C9]|uniref:DUF2157 domain-containing protein n=1 Tax=Dyella sp. C9 TaxID=2202154 RepID=UPI000DEF214D|nr:DUF2157 domain-containing protein [Dyella sp. C9]
MKKATSELLAQESADWHHRGLIDAELFNRLGQRYDRKGAASRGLIAWLGLAAAFLLGMAILTAVGLMMNSPVAGGVLLLIVAGGLWYAGIRMATHPLQRHPFSGSALVTIGLSALYGAMWLMATASSDDFSGSRMSSLLVLTGLVAAATAYAYHLRWPLLLSLICLFHGVGAWHSYAGGGAYVADIQDPAVMALFAALCTAFGLWHQQAEERSWASLAGFGRLYVIFGLLYLNVSLWFLSLDAYGNNHALAWVWEFTLVCIAQIGLGARLKDGKLTGFGVVFLAIDLYTRLFEQFWDRLSLGWLLLLAGLSAALLGWMFERRAQRATP